MTHEEETAKLMTDLSVPCIKIEICISPLGPILTASHSSIMTDPEFANDIKDNINAAADAALRAALAELQKSSSYEGERVVLDRNGVMDENFFDSKKTVTLDME